MEIKIHVSFLFWKYRLANTGRYFLHRREIDRMVDNQTEKQKVQELTDKLERGLTELFNSESYKICRIISNATKLNIGTNSMTSLYGGNFDFTKV